VHGFITEKRHALEAESWARIVWALSSHPWCRACSQSAEFAMRRTVGEEGRHRDSAW